MTTSTSREQISKQVEVGAVHYHFWSCCCSPLRRKTLAEVSLAIPLPLGTHLFGGAQEWTTESGLGWGSAVRRLGGSGRSLVEPRSALWSEGIAPGGLGRSPQCQLLQCVGLSRPSLLRAVIAHVNAKHTMKCPRGTVASPRTYRHLLKIVVNPQWTHWMEWTSRHPNSDLIGWLHWAQAVRDLVPYLDSWGKKWRLLALCP